MRGAALFRSFRARTLAGVLGVLPILVLSAAYILFATIRLQDSMNRGIDRQLEIRGLQSALAEYQAPLLDYLATRSSNALSELLIMAQHLRATVPVSVRVPSDPVLLQESELHSLVLAYLDLTDRVIDEKRGLDVEGYTSLYDGSRRALEYIDERIDAISAERLSEQADAYGRFIATSRAVQSWNLAFIACVSLFAGTLIFATVDKISRPMSDLSRSAELISSGNFEGVDVSLSSIDEMDGVISAFNRMKRDIHTYIEELKWQRSVEQDYLKERMRYMHMEETFRRMELYTMQAQMNPHFLFNSLNTGIQLAIVEGAERTGDYMDRLSRLLRHNIREKESFVPLRHEIEGLETYFYLLGVRFPKNLDLTLDCPPDILDKYTVPVTILQPLVENCVVHAFRNAVRAEGEKNAIAVRVAPDGQVLRLSVADNGSGMDEATLASLLGGAEGPERQAGAGGAAGANPGGGGYPEEQGADFPRGVKVMGLENVIQRLRFFWPDDPGVVAIESAPGKGTVIRIRLDGEKKPCIPY